MPKKKTAAKHKPASASSSARPVFGIPSVEVLTKMMKEQGVKTDQDMKTFIASLLGNAALSELSEAGPTADENDALDLVEQAYGADPEEAQDLCRQALDIDPFCIEAFLRLGQLEEQPSIQVALFKRGMDLGKERFDEAFYKEHKGRFWMIHETRPFMRCVASYADALFFLGEFEPAVDAWMALLEMNSSDNQGVREPALLCLAALGDEEDFKEYDDRFKDDDMCGTLFNRALMQHRVGHSAKAQQLLKKANARNLHVIPFLLAPEPPGYQFGPYGLGSREDALTYVRYAWNIFHAAPGAMDLLHQLK